MMASLKAAPKSAKLDIVVGIIVGIATMCVPRFELTCLPGRQMSVRPITMHASAFCGQEFDKKKIS
jgi:hypothetical protein